MSPPSDEPGQGSKAVSTGPSELTPRLYDDLRALAEALLRQERPDHTLQPTALVHEAYVRLAEIDRMRFRDEAHFASAAAGAIRRVLVDHARAKKAAKRGGGWKRLTLSGLEGMPAASTIDMLALNDALTRLAGLDERGVRVVELRFFGGMTIEETARLLGVGVTTVKEKWEFARVWLQRELA
jgi:RNA polymerase sigma factor (TIGR02999 family)